MDTERQPIRIVDKKGKNHRPEPAPVPPEQEELLRRQAEQLAQEERENEEALNEFPEGTVFAQTAYLMILLPDGTWVVETSFDKNVAVQRQPHRTDFIAGCAAIGSKVQTDSASDLAAAKVMMSLQGMGQQMAATRTADEVQPGAPNGMNRAARRRG